MEFGVHFAPRSIFGGIAEIAPTCFDVCFLHKADTLNQCPLLGVKRTLMSGVEAEWENQFTAKQ
jgi:hypothetical protein